MAANEYRWNQLQAAAAYDAAAPVIHPCYEAVQEAVLAAIPFPADAPFRAVDLGGGSGRLAERLLENFPNCSVILLDQSEAFLSLAKDRLAPFDGRAACLQRRLQDDWSRDIAPADLFVSTSAIHHLEDDEKLALFQKCRAALSPGGALINGDEYRPAEDETYRGLLVEWSQHMEKSLATGAIPATFADTLTAWKQRNLDGFSSSRKSGDDCPETIEAQLDRLRNAGFAESRATWSNALWAVLVARR